MTETKKTDTSICLDPAAPCNASSETLVTKSAEFCLHRAGEMRKQIDQSAAEIEQRNEKMRLINQIISEINTLTDENQGLDISKNGPLQEKFQMARELGVSLPEGKMKFDAIQRDRLITNLQLAFDNLDRENKLQTQKMETFLREFQRWLSIANDVRKMHDKSIQSMATHIKG